MATKVRHAPQDDAPAGEGDWAAKLRGFAYQLSVLKVVTYVGKATVTTNDDGVVTDIQIDGDGDPFVTVLDLIGGDATNVIPDRFKANEKLQTFHAAQVDKAAAVIPNNIKAVADVIDRIFS